MSDMTLVYCHRRLKNHKIWMCFCIQSSSRVLFNYPFQFQYEISYQSRFSFTFTSHYQYRTVMDWTPFVTVPISTVVQKFGGTLCFYKHSRYGKMFWKFKLNGFMNLNETHKSCVEHSQVCLQRDLFSSVYSLHGKICVWMLWCAFLY
jgi:hypothetical protein